MTRPTMPSVGALGWGPAVTAAIYAVSDVADAALPATQKAVANGVATLDGTGVIPAGQIPPVSVTKAQVGLGNVDNTTDASKPLSTAATLALAAKADLVAGLIPTSQIPSLALTTVVTAADQTAMLALTTTQVQPGDIAIRTDGAGSFILTAADPSVLGNWTVLSVPSTGGVVSINGQTGTVVLAKADLALGNVDNTSDVNKPVSSAQAIINSQKAPLASPAFTGTPTGISKTHVGLSNVDNTADTAKPVSTAQQTALNAKADLVGGFVPTSQIPAIALGTSVPVASQAAMLALTATQVQPGDLAIRSDGAGTFMLMAADPSIIGNWTLLNTPTDVVSSVNGQTGTVVLTATIINAEPAFTLLPIAKAPAKTVCVMVKSGSTWPARETNRTDITGIWIGADPSPAVVTSPSTGGMYNGDVRFIV